MRRDAFAGRLFRETVAQVETPQLLSDRSGDDDEAVEAVLEAVLDDERGLVDGEVPPLRGEPLEPVLHRKADAGMKDGVQRQPLLGIREDACSQGLAVERPVRREHTGKTGLDLAQAFRALGDDVPGDEVGIDDRDPLLGEQACNRALPGSDVAGETEDPHRTPTVAKLA